ncbi:MAG: sigma-70 family RNA polymerase sigma factor [Fulvivirga sp.]|uniref:RNA polymerase sigma factor n=1 Tax=Fulvivirga sp. TaxID=1931237 RepID=UPI0032ED66D7
MSPGITGVLEQNQIVNLLKQRDKSALAYLYDHYSAAIYGNVLRILGDEDVAKEVLQDAFMKYWDKIDSFDSSKGRLFTWMLNLARNLAIDKLRSKEIKKVQKTDDLADNVYNVESGNLIHQSIDGSGVKELMNNLREEERNILEFVYFKGYTQSEITEETGIPLGTVKTRLRMALKSLRSILRVE